MSREWLRGLFQKRVITGCETPGPYLTRRTLFASPWRTVYLHQFHRSDEGTILHDHPWDFVSVILWGGYWEWTLRPDGEQRREWIFPGEVLRRPANWAHRVEVNPGCLPWTLVIVTERKRKWGFHTPSGWVHWKAHLRALGCMVDDGDSQ